MVTELHVREANVEGGTAAFDLWLRHGLRQMYSDVLKEPVPDELVALVLN